ncbi:hypothetical protein D7Y50_03820 [Stenotrophomonas maltophilia]|nr:hypothetical protein [Stenotrophomonas maltophilia]
MKQRNSTLAGVYNSIIEALVREGYASLTTEMFREIDRRKGFKDSTGRTIFQEFADCLPPFVRSYVNSVDMSTFDKHRQDNFNAQLDLA